MFGYGWRFPLNSDSWQRSGQVVSLGVMGEQWSLRQPPSPLGSSLILWAFWMSCGSKRLKLAMCTHALWADWKPWFEKAIYCLEKAKRVTFDLLCSCIDVVWLWVWICEIAFWAVSWWSVPLSTWYCWACNSKGMVEKRLFWCVWKALLCAAFLFIFMVLKRWLIVLFKFSFNLHVIRLKCGLNFTFKNDVESCQLSVYYTTDTISC